jgi:hypothetical protein
MPKKIENPLKFQWADLGAGTPPVTVHGSARPAMRIKYTHIARTTMLQISATHPVALPLKSTLYRPRLNPLTTAKKISAALK